MDLFNHNIITEISKHLNLADRSRFKRLNKLFYKTIILPIPTKKQLKIYELKKVLRYAKKGPFVEDDGIDIQVLMILSSFKTGLTDFETIFSLLRSYNLESEKIYESIIKNVLPSKFGYLQSDEWISHLTELSKYWIEYIDKHIDKWYFPEGTGINS